MPKICKWCQDEILSQETYIPIQTKEGLIYFCGKYKCYTAFRRNGNRSLEEVRKSGDEVK